MDFVEKEKIDNATEMMFDSATERDAVEKVKKVWGKYVSPFFSEPNYLVNWKVK